MRDAKVEIKIGKSLVRDIRVNGIPIPNVTQMTVSYNVMDVRRMTIELLPTEIVEIDEADW